MPEKKTILVVCTGNICRSPVGEGLLKAQLNPEKYTVISAGTRTIDGCKAAGESIKLCHNRGIDISEHRSVQLTDEHFEKSDLVFIMEHDHLFDIERYFPAYLDKVFLLKKFPEGNSYIKHEDNVHDPFGGEYEEYLECFEDIEEHIKRIIPEIEKYFGSKENTHSADR